ncbi:MAG TPA: Fe-Mn family superoxide dismutase [Blastocatellia bacterium]|nr:Fe-Mn family superoxide dismutase [Blastocatellia bacterium]
MNSNLIYKPRQFDLSGLIGISDETLDMHFKLYEGYVKQTNLLNEQIAEIIKNRQASKEDMPAYSELTRRLGFEYNGMVLHEFYFGNMKRDGSSEPARNSRFFMAVEESFGSLDIWKADFTSIGKMRGVGWAICFQDPANGHLSNHWITLHQEGNIAGFNPILVMDVWEHAYLLDYKPAERPKYIEAFLSNVDWDVIEQRLKKGVVARNVTSSG